MGSIGAADFKVLRLIEGGDKSRRQRGGTVNVAGISHLAWPPLILPASLGILSKPFCLARPIELVRSAIIKPCAFWGQSMPARCQHVHDRCDSASGETLLMALIWKGSSCAGSGLFQRINKMSYFDCDGN